MPGGLIGHNNIACATFCLCTGLHRCGVAVAGSVGDPLGLRLTLDTPSQTGNSIRQSVAREKVREQSTPPPATFEKSGVNKAGEMIGNGVLVFSHSIGNGKQTRG